MDSHSPLPDETPLPTFHLTVVYDGTRYSGWQVQPGRLTVQAELERAVATLIGKPGKKAKPAGTPNRDEQPLRSERTTSDSSNDSRSGDVANIDVANIDVAHIKTASGDTGPDEITSNATDGARSFRVLGSGRTDAGVHAWGQVARCVLPNWRADATAVMRGINSRLPDDITVVDVRETVPSFHPIADAIGKRYRYQIQIGGHRDPFAVRTRYRVPWPIDVDLLSAAAEKFVGCHDFAAFQAAGAVRASTVRTITHSVWTREAAEPSGGAFAGGVNSNLAGKSTGQFSERFAEEFAGQRWFYEVEGNGFLYNMVRNLVGTMLDVARGYRPVEWIDEVLESKNRQMAGATAPPQGLFLCRVNYPSEVFLTPSLMLMET